MKIISTLVRGVVRMKNFVSHPRREGGTSGLWLGGLRGGCSLYLQLTAGD